MTIEFSCGHCGKALSTGDDKAGRKAKCPGCGEPVQVPTVNTDGEDLADQLASAPVVGAARSSGQRQRHTECPMCGHKVAADETECSACGEPLTSASRQSARKSAGDAVPFEVGVVLSRSWEIYKSDLGLVVGGQIVAGLLGIAALVPGMGMLIGAVVSADQGGDDMLPLVLGLGIFGFILLVIGSLVMLWLNIGVHKLLLGLVRGKDVSFSTLFEGKRCLGRMFACSFLYNIMEQIGQRLCIIPGLLVHVYFWPYMYVLIDDDSPNIQALLESPKVASPSALSSFLLMLVSVGIFCLGMLAIVVGLIFALPFIQLAWAVAYDEMRGGDFDADSEDRYDE